ncbi:hypothetical protein EJ05DRAFT_511873 [Pseudovirgaria hyperparasitica]|uniref:Uncharacterized protein n=1 Tax=Pseudovirgaria hyperparasitica TaxID=470096 RepID=A0A6A6W6E7_9PEZI|nr:uncharacterized protein EJ05DRAFT_511873 [Pseudovirgaria hyperparasitica]KAF2757137.1 hypothetical protein EJ05DRAFT_511873 [Pseudovirgaria hyperparasitica]
MLDPKNLGRTVNSVHVCSSCKEFPQQPRNNTPRTQPEEQIPLDQDNTTQNNPSANEVAHREENEEPHRTVDEHHIGMEGAEGSNAAGNSLPPPAQTQKPNKPVRSGLISKEATKVARDTETHDRPSSNTRLQQAKKAPARPTACSGRKKRARRDDDLVGPATKMARPATCISRRSTMTALHRS